uniref:SFRICE_020381 n=1 Tax=Spodoptera frugiperda TaxID=7108 RepID=A0A2H1WAB0_SPOFR
MLEAHIHEHFATITESCVLKLFEFLLPIAKKSTVEVPYSRFLHSRFHYSRIEKLRPNSHIRGLRFLNSRIESKYQCVT